VYISQARQEQAYSHFISPQVSLFGFVSYACCNCTTISFLLATSLIYCCQFIFLDLFRSETCCKQPNFHLEIRTPNHSLTFQTSILPIWCKTHLKRYSIHLISKWTTWGLSMCQCTSNCVQHLSYSAWSNSSGNCNTVSLHSTTALTAIGLIYVAFAALVSCVSCFVCFKKC
jgi:hypothetical protein